MSNTIRRITERKPCSENHPEGFEMVYQVGTIYTVAYEEVENQRPVKIKKKISAIMLVDDHFHIYVLGDNEEFLWKELGKTAYVSVEYQID